MTHEQILTSIDDGVLTITMHRPERLNAWTPTMSAEMTGAIMAANQDPSVIAIVVTGAAPDPERRYALEISADGIQVVPADELLDRCYEMAQRISGFSQLGVELSKQMLWAGIDAGSLHTHMNHEGHAQLFVRMTTKNFEEAISARREGRAPRFDD